MSEEEKKTSMRQNGNGSFLLATQTLMTESTAPKMMPDAPRVDMMTGIEESQDDAESDRCLKSQRLFRWLRAPAVTRKTPLGEDSTKKNDRQRVGLGYSAVPRYQIAHL
jgi:hypothetical protein